MNKFLLKLHYRAKDACCSLFVRCGGWIVCLFCINKWIKLSLVGIYIRRPEAKYVMGAVCGTGLINQYPYPTGGHCQMGGSVWGYTQKENISNQTSM